VAEFWAGRNRGTDQGHLEGVWLWRKAWKDDFALHGRSGCSILQTDTITLPMLFYKLMLPHEVVESNSPPLDSGQTLVAVSINGAPLGWGRGKLGHKRSSRFHLIPVILTSEVISPVWALWLSQGHQCEKTWTGLVHVERPHRGPETTQRNRDAWSATVVLAKFIPLALHVYGFHTHGVNQPWIKNNQKKIVSTLNV
jgi:hypothetical protein